MSYVYNPLWPTFEVGGKKFAVTIQEDDWTDVVLLEQVNGVWQSWGGTADVSGTIVSMVDDGKIMAKGSLANFVQYVLDEAMRRAKARANVLPLPDPNNRIDRLKYALKARVTVSPGPVLELDARRRYPSTHSPA